MNFIIENKIKIVVATVIVVAIALGIYGTQRGPDAEVSSADTRTGVLQQDRQADIAAIRRFMGDDQYSVAFYDASSPSNFTVGITTPFPDGGGGRTDVPPEWKRTVNKYKSTEGIGIREEIYYFEVDPRTHEVVNAQLDNQQDRQVKPITGEAPKDDGIYTPKISESEIKTIGDAYLTRAIPDYPSIKGNFTVKPLTKDPGVTSADRYQWLWQDTSYKVPEGIDAEPKYPTVRIYISSGGKLLQYNNSVPLFQK